MLSERDQAGRPVSEEWHRRRAEARRTAFSEEEFDAIDQERYDLDTAGITGEDHPATTRGTGNDIDGAGVIDTGDVDELERDG